MRDLRVSLAEAYRAAGPDEVEAAATYTLDRMVDEIILGMCFDVHRSVKTGVYSLTEVPEPRDARGPGGPGGTDVFGQVITTAVGVPTLKKQPECVCPNCQRNMAATR